MEMHSRTSRDYDGTHDLKVKCFISDRNSNLTSNKAVADMLRRRIKHSMAPTDARNSTPLLDNVIRRLEDIARSLLDGAGLGRAMLG